LGTQDTGNIGHMTLATLGTQDTDTIGHRTLALLGTQDSGNIGNKGHWQHWAHRTLAT
jgi:hypothetical protein